MVYKKIFGLFIIAVAAAQLGCQPGSENQVFDSNNVQGITDDNATDPETGVESEPESPEEGIASEEGAHTHLDNSIGYEVLKTNCSKASSTQKDYVYLGWTKMDEFLQKCANETNNSSWCAQVVRPNPSSASTFGCTYGSAQPHNLVHPDENTWKYPIAGVKILQDLSAKGINVTQIYNWWRPEPYNKNVGGAAGRHPYGTSIDVRFASSSEANRAFKELCKMRKAGRLRALGHYGSSSLHIGIGDKTANTWGKSCN